MQGTLESTRVGYGRAMEKLSKSRKDIVVIDADLAESTRSIMFKKYAPERFFYAGICEQNAIGLAAGLALSGKMVFVSSFAIFITGRAWEVIRQSVCYNNVPVKIVGSHAGILTGKDGPTAHATEDIAIMRVLPRMNVIVPADSIEAEHATLFLADFNEPCYLRTNREATPVIFEEQNYKFEFGKASLLCEGSDVTIIACGSLVPIAIEACKELEKNGIKARVINMPTIKPLDRKAVIKAAKETGAIITAEDHQIIGGLGSAVAEVLAEEKLCVPFERIGLNGFAESGSPKELYEKYGLNKERIKATVKKILCFAR
ncbi:MAG: transketolase family protein [Candidatus Diapherotrites archaeon]|nr:transketolase family protein [Candidatus Diapherotrites archaeon]